MNNIEKFMSKVQQTSNCWLWISGKTGLGYGQFCHDGIIEYSHRFSYRAFVGEIPEGFEVLHKCDNPSCVNPNHLKAGTHKDNMHDMLNKNRNVVLAGEDNPVSKLTWATVREIRKLYSTGKYSHRKLGSMFGVSNRNISSITRNDTWRE